MMDVETWVTNAVVVFSAVASGWKVLQRLDRIESILRSYSLEQAEIQSRVVGVEKRLTIVEDHAA